VRNEPANLVVAVEAIAEIKGTRKAEIIEAIADNTDRLYPGIIQTNVRNSCREA